MVEYGRYGSANSTNLRDMTMFQSDGAIHFLEVRYNPSKPPDSVSLMTPNIRDVFLSFGFL